MKGFFLMLSAMLWSCVVAAQDDKTFVAATDTVVSLNHEPADIAVGEVGVGHEPSSFQDFPDNIQLQDSLRLPLLNQYGQARINMYPLDWGRAYGWDLHSGLNVNIGLSAFATFGNSAWKGTGFSQNISAMYAVPLTGKMSFAVGGWLSNMSWSHDSWRDAGLNAVFEYRFDEHWEGYIYGQKSLVDKRIPYPLYDLNRIGDRIGAAVRYNFNPCFSIQVSVERGNN